MTRSILFLFVEKENIMTTNSTSNMSAKYLVRWKNIATYSDLCALGASWLRIRISKPGIADRTNVVFGACRDS